MIKNIIIIFSILCVLLLGCESAKPKPTIKSIADTSYTGVIKRLFIVAQLPENGWPELESSPDENSIAHFTLFKKSIINIFKKMDVSTECEVLTGSDLSDYELKRKIAAFRAEALMTIHSIKYNLKDNVLSDIVFDVSIFDENTSKRIWKANFVINTLDSTSGLIQADGKSISDNVSKIVLDQLAVDGMNIFR